MLRSDLKIAAYQGPSPQGDDASAFDAIEYWSAKAATRGASMIVFSELFLPGYNQPHRHNPMAQPQGGPWESRLSRLAKSLGCGITIGWSERCGDQVYNAASTFGPDGQKLAHYRKIQLWGDMERGIFSPGNAYATFTFAGKECALLICYDIEFPQHVRALQERGVELLFVPTANPAGFDHVADIMVPSRAAECRMTIAYANYCGSEGYLRYGGLSCVVGPETTFLAKARNDETLLVANVPNYADLSEKLLSTQLVDYQPI